MRSSFQLSARVPYLTVTVTGLFTPLAARTQMTQVPGEWPVITPEPLMVATFSSLLR